jgi:hypothetical protein
MPLVRLDRHEAENGYLPPVCMRCGAPATCQRRQNFKHSGGEGLVVNTWVVAPLCDAHRGHFSVRRLAVPLVLITLGIGFCGGLFAAVRANADASVAQIIFLAAGIGFLGWIVMSVILHYTQIRLFAFQSGSLELIGVADEFVDAVANHRQSPQHKTPLSLQGVEQSRRQVRLGRGEAESLPAVCICCGDEATHWTQQKFSSRARAEISSSSALGILSFFVLGVGWISRNRNTLPSPWYVRLPVCHRHRAYWAWRFWLSLGSFLLLLGLVPVAFALVRVTGGWACLGLIVGFCLWVSLAIYLQETTIQPYEVTEETLAMKFVSERFVAAVEQRRQKIRNLTTESEPFLPPPPGPHIRRSSP